jgi:hypothetical protein
MVDIDKNRTREAWWERYYPVVGAIVGSILVIVLHRAYPVWRLEGFDNVLGAVITFSSIAVGFMGTLLAILVSIRNSEVVNLIYSTVAKKMFMGYLRGSIVAGMATVILSSVLYLVRRGRLGFSITIIWAFFVSYFGLSAYRIIDILLLIIFKDASAENRRPPGNMMPDHEAEELRRKYGAAPTSPTSVTTSKELGGRQT